MQRCRDGLDRGVSVFISTDSSGREKEGEKKDEREEKEIQDWDTGRKEITCQHVNCVQFPYDILRQCIKSCTRDRKICGPISQASLSSLVSLGVTSLYQIQSHTCKQWDSCALHLAHKTAEPPANISSHSRVICTETYLPW